MMEQLAQMFDLPSWDSVEEMNIDYITSAYSEGVYERAWA